MPQVTSQDSRNFTLYPLVWLCGCFIAGIWFGSVFDCTWQLCLTVCLVFVFLSFVFIAKNFSNILIFAAFIALGAFCLDVDKHSTAPDRLSVLFDSSFVKSGEAYEITGTAQGLPELAVGGFFLILRAEKLVVGDVDTAATGSIRLFFPVSDEQAAQEYEQLQIKYGTKLRVACELKREEKYQNPGAISTIAMLEQQGIDATGIVKSPMLVESIGRSQTFAPLTWLSQRRQDLILEFKRFFSVSTAGVLIASLLGNKYHLTKQISEPFREGGTFHILVISGLQITFIGGLVILFLRRFTTNRFWQFLLASTFLWTYTLSVGADPPVTRASLMFTVFCFAPVVFRQSNLPNSLGISAFALLIWNPTLVFGQSYQLTFVSVLAIVSVAVPLVGKLRQIGKWHPGVQQPIPPNVPKWLKSLCEILYWSEENWRKESERTVWQCKLSKTPFAEKFERWKIQKIVRYVFETIVVSCAVQISLLPFSVIYFHRISPASILLNVPVCFLIAIESLTALSGIFVAQISEFMAVPFIWMTEALNWLILNTTISIIGLDWSSWRIPHYSGQMKIVYVLYFMPLTVLIFKGLQWDPFALKIKVPNRDNAFRLSALSFLVIVSIIIFHPFSAPVADGKLHIEFIDVGQGDSALITMPTGETLLIDGGGRADFRDIYIQRQGEDPELFEPDTQNIGESVVSRFLWEKGYDRVDYLLATHADTDHIQGLTDVAKNFKINSSFVARAPFEDPDFADFYSILEKKQIPAVLVSRGDRLSLGEVKIEILHPETNRFSNGKWDNNNSIVLRIVFGETSYLFTGDIEKEAEKELLKTPELVKANVIKTAHHGSNTSSTADFIRASGSELAVISVGKRSQFDHPHRDVISRWQNAGTKILTTGDNGTISLTSDGKVTIFQTFRDKPVYR